MSTLRRLFYRLPSGWRHFARRLIYLPADAVDTVLRRRQPMVPPKGMTFIGSGDFLATGQHQRDMLIRHARLTPGDTVLDVGCGLGRTAVALTEYMTENGRYEGFDIMKKAILWCKNKISSRYPNFAFHHVILGNDLYNEGGGDSAAFTFPFDSEKFDVIFLFSVFTHMLPDEVDNYFIEIMRTLKKNGRCLATFFIFNEENEEKISRREGLFQFPYKRVGYRLMDENALRANVAYSQNFIEKMIFDHDFVIEKQVKGYWRGEKNETNDFQDIIVIHKSK